MSIKNNIATFTQNLPTHCKLVAVSKTQPLSAIKEAYDAGQRIFGENKVQELVSKYEALPKDIRWHMIGHLQRNKVKYIAPFVSLIHSVDSTGLLVEINKQGEKNNRIVDCLLQIYIAKEETKFGFSEDEVLTLLQGDLLPTLKHVSVKGLMGMATFTENKHQVREEFKSLKQLFDKIKQMNVAENVMMKELSMGMSGDFQLAAEEGSTLLRIGTAIFGERN